MIVSQSTVHCSTTYIVELHHCQESYLIKCERPILFFIIKTLKSAKAIYTSFGRLHSLQNDTMPTKQEGVVAIKD